MTETAFFASVDALKYLREEQKETEQKLLDLNEEIYAIIRELEELILDSETELRTDGGKTCFVNLRVYSGLEGSQSPAINEITAAIGELTGKKQQPVKAAAS